MGELIFYLDGQFVPASEAKVSVLDLGLVRGFGIFDFLRTYHGKPFKLEEHLLRLKNSAEQISLKIPWSLKQLEKIIYQTLKKNNLAEANIKILVTGGVSPDQITPAKLPTLAVLVYPPAVYPSSFYQKGIAVVTVPFGRAYPGAKTINYIPAIIALAQAKRKRAIEALYTNEKKEVLEGTTTSFFVFKRHTLITPKDEVLLGITRQVVLSLARTIFQIELRPIKYQELKSIDEAFICASNKEIMPVVKVDNIVVGNGRVGTNTRRIMALFKKYTWGHEKN
jgi:branched-chain amino acid aminotransferase